MRPTLRFFCFLSPLLFLPVPTSAQEVNATAAPAQEQKLDSVKMLQAQIDELTRMAQSGDQAAFHAALDSFEIPHAEDWITAHFAAENVAQLKQEYAGQLSGFQSHISWVLGNWENYSGFAIKVESSALSQPPAATGEETVLPKPAAPVSVENFRFQAVSSSGGPPSWVNSFALLDGKFRLVGGTCPFWNERLQGLRAKVLTVTRPKLIYSVPPIYPQDAKWMHAEGTIELRVIINADGEPRNIEVISGSPMLVDAAIDAVRQWRYQPTLLMGEPVEVTTTISVNFVLSHH